jgi:hypothetical protein
MKRLPLCGPPTALLLALLGGCGSTTSTSTAWPQDLTALVDHGNAVFASVAALPECADLPSKTGTIRWLPSVWCGTEPAVGCTYPDAHAIQVQVIPQTAWGVQNPDQSTLAHELCHACGYRDEREAEACAQRSRSNFNRPALVGTARVDSSPAPDVTASLIEGTGRLAADAVRRGDRGHARELLQAALRAIAEPAPEEGR